MKDKIIRSSQRGLTFSFPSKGKLTIGQQYEYIICKEPASIQILPSVSGKYTVSRKRSGSSWKSLVDLRSREVLDLIAKMERIRIQFIDDAIVVTDAEEKICKTERSSSKILVFPRTELLQLRLAAGLDGAVAAGRLLDYAQISLDEYLASCEQPLSIPVIQKELSEVYTLVSLFSGAGILDWPFAQDKRFKLLYAIDNDAAACETYRHNIGLHIVHGDIHRAFTAQGYPQDNTVTAPDTVIGGPPCKPFSNANRHTRLTDHPDSDLVVQYMRIVKALHPKVFAMENVPEVLTACGGSYYEAIQEVAKECGYHVDARVIQDNHVGGYTTRRRAIILGSRIGEVDFDAFITETGGKTVGEALEKVNKSWSNYNDITLPGKETKKRMSFVPQGGNYESIPPEYQTAGKNRHSSTYRRLCLDEPAPTIVNWRKPPLIHPTEDRTLSVAEAKALQGLPGKYRIFGSLGQMQQQVGNAVPVALGSYIKQAVLSLLRNGAEKIQPANSFA